MPASTAIPILTNRDALLDAVRAADVLTPQQQLKAATVTSDGSADDAARALVAAGLLTRFQADRLLAGRTDGFVLGQYVIHDQIGRGSMGRVYKAKHRTMHRAVAIKVLSAELTRTTEARQALQREVRAAGRLAHPNIVTAYDANELQDRFYLVLEFVEGPSLDALVLQRGPLPVAEACEFVRQIAAGLQHAHDQGMVHRNLKPGNLLVARSTPSAAPTVKVADFGIARRAPGDVDFVAPEQIHYPHAADSRVDLYSLGCVFYFLLTGRPPFHGGSTEEKIRRHSWEEAQRVEQVRSDVPAEVAAIIHRLLAKYPTDRFASAAELLARLDAACVPVAIPVEGASFDAPPAHDSGYITGRYAGTLPGSGTVPLPVPRVELSPWAQLTDEVTGDTVPLEPDATPAPLPQKSSKPHRSASTGHGESVPWWMTAVLLTGVVMLCMMGIGVLIRVLGK